MAFEDKIISEQLLTMGVTIDKNTGCWNYPVRSKDGYGRYRRERVDLCAHRVAAMLWLDFDINSELLVCHHCDNPACINPEHLFIGTDLDNSRDAQKKGRLRNGKLSGSANPRAKINEQIVSAIRNAYQQGMTQAMLSRQYGISKSAIWAIVHRLVWKEVGSNLGVTTTDS